MNGDGIEYVRQQAIQGAAKRLRAAATFVQLNTKNPLFQRRMGKGASSVLVRFEWPGVLRVIDPETGELLAESECGSPHALRPGFVPPLPGTVGGAGTP